MPAIIGPSHVADFNAEVRKYSKSDKVWFRARRIAPMGAILAEKFRKETVTDPKYIDFEDREPTLDGVAYGESGGAAAALTTTATTLYIANASNYIKPGDNLRFDSFEETNNNIANAKPEGEVMHVLDTTGNVVTVIRNVGTTSTYNVSTASGSVSLHWKKIGNAEREGGSSRVPKSYPLEESYNYIQSFEEPWAVTELTKKTKTYGTEERVRNQKQALIAITRGVEGMRIFGVRYEATDNGAKKRFSGGAIWHLNQANSNAGISAWSSTTDLVNGDGTSRIWVPGADFNKRRWELFFSRAMKEGNPTKIGFHGHDFLRQLKSLYDDQIRLEEKQTTRGVTLNEYESQGCRIQFVYEPEMDKLPSTERGLLLLDLEYIADAVMTDITPRSDLQDNDERAEKGDYIADMGLKMHFIQAHSAILGLQDVAS